jgi:hypothetical protein
VLARTGTGTFTQVALSAEGGAATVTGLTPGTRYDIKLVKVNAIGWQSNVSKAVTVTTR